MTYGQGIGRNSLVIAAFAIMVGLLALSIVPVAAQSAPQGGPELHLFAAEDFGVDPAGVSFTADIAPILNRSCVRCHREGGVGPMALTSYEQARRYAQRIYTKTAIRDRMGAMPPWYVEKDLGIQHFKQDPSLSDEELALIQAWVGNGTPEGDPALLPPLPVFREAASWTIEPDLIVSSGEIFMEGGAADWWGEIDAIPVPLEEDRYVRALEVREINDVPPEGTGRETVGGRWIVHHSTFTSRVPGEGALEGTTWPVHEVGRNADVFDPQAAPLLKAGSEIRSQSTHLHSNGRDTRARLEFAFEFYPPDYEPTHRRARLAMGDGLNISVQPGKAQQELHTYRVLDEHIKIVSFEPHLHAPGDRMCLEAIWDRHIETINCVGYDHNWVRTYFYEDDYQPLLPKGTVLHMVGFMDNTEANPNVADPRNWQGSGNRSVANMFLELGLQVSLTDEQFVEEMAKRRDKLGLGVNDHVVGCPLCMAGIPPLEAEEPETGDGDAADASAGTRR